MRIGAMRTRSIDRDLEPERTLLAEPDAEGTRWLAVEQCIAVHLRMMLHEVSRAIGSERLLVGDGSQCQLALEVLSEPMQIDIREDRSSGAGLHVGDAAPVDLAVGDLAAPRVLGPAGAVIGDRENINVSIEDEMPAFAGAIEAADDVGHLRMRRDDAIRKIALSQEAGDELGGAACITWWVRTLVAHEFLQKAYEI